MKSIMEEASSIARAIENAWIRAEKPAEFTVKVFEQPEKNMFGITTKPAKIALIFKEMPVKEAKPKPAKRPIRPEAPKRQPLPEAPTEAPKKQPPQEKPRVGPWTKEMAATAESWIKECLVLSGLPKITFTTSIAGNNLKVHFSAPVVGDKAQERILFSSFAHLILETLRNKYKKPLRTLKVVLNSG